MIVRKLAKLLVPTLVAPLLATSAYAESPPVSASDGPTFGIGARVGGYGFREVKGDSLSWNDCRMNGTGLFGTVDLGKHFFGELSADLYNATAGPVSEGMDRTSLHTLAAVGARMLPGYWLTPYVQVGGGPEFTRIDVDGVTDKRVLPEAFMGVGGELNWKQLHFGTTLRVFSMGLPTHGHGAEHAHDGTVRQALEGEDAIELRHEVAAQMLFSMRYHF